jgi:hypothetical protein
MEREYVLQDGDWVSPVGMKSLIRPGDQGEISANRR